MTGTGPSPEPTPRGDGGASSAWRLRIWHWLDRRTGADQLLRTSLDEPIPGGARLAYVFGSGLLFIFLSQVVTGVSLAVYYVPSPLSAHVTLSYIVKEVAGGAFLRSLHSYGSSAMVVVLVLHFLQTFLFGSYKGRRELLWISGSVTALLVLGMTFTGYLLRWDLNAFFAGSVGTNIAGDVPFVGGWLLRMLRGGSTMGALTLSRFYAFHVFVLPATIFLFIALHVFFFRKAGAAGPVHADPVHPALATEPFYPRQVIIDMTFVLIVMGLLGMLAHFVPVALGPIADPSNGTYLPRPEWYYLPFFQWLKFWEGAKTVIGVVIIPAVLLALIVFLPFLDRGRERRPWKRPIPVGAVLIVLIGLIGLGMQSRLDDSRDPTTVAQIAKQDLAESQFVHAPFEPLAAPSDSGGAAPATAATGATASAVPSKAASRGKTLFDSHGCSGCHGVDGAGGGIGPALTGISGRFSPAQLTALLKAPNAGMKAGGMSALTLNAADMTALVSYLGSLGGGPAPATSAVATTAGAPGGSVAVSASTVSDTGSGSGKPSGAAGRAIYQSDGCAACHGAGGTGTARAPALTGVGAKLSAARISALLRTPNAAMVAGGMPPAKGSAKDIASLVAYLRSLSSTAVAHGAVASASAGAGTAATQAPPPAVSTTNPKATSPVTPVAKTPTSVTKTSKPIATTAASATDTLPAVASQAAATDQRGAAIFTARGCAACHGVGGVGTRSAPALTAFSKTLTPAALTSLLQHPNHKMQAGGMPAVAISATDMTALVSYLQHLGTPATSGAAVVAARGSSSPAQSAATVSKPDSTSTVAGASGTSARPMNQLELLGHMVFTAHSCATCHGRDGVGGSWAAPALANTGKSFPAVLLVTMLQHPTLRMRQGAMPAVSLSQGELDALAAYVSFISSKPPAPPAPPASRVSP
ncbi:MAG: c-type cytochrome [bacterium]